MIFPVRTTVLVANVQNTVVWTGSDFQSALGYAQPEKPISMAFSVQNNTTQVCYVAISYQTRNLTYVINNRRSIVGIPANSALRIASNLAPELASLGPDLVSVTLYLISAAAGNVLTSAEAFEGVNTFGVGGGGQNIGLDQRSVLDYVPKYLQLFANLTGGQQNIQSYLVPAGKRADVISIFGLLPPTPFGYADCTIKFTAIGFSYTLSSVSFESSRVDMAGILASINAGDNVQLIADNLNPSAAVSRLFSAQINIKEYFS